MGRTMNCPKCQTCLAVDRFDLSKAKGDLVDMTHLELDRGDPLADTAGFGSTVGGSSIKLAGGSKGGSSLGGSRGGAGFAPGLGGDSTDSQTQMRELRELNDLKHSGEISAEEYRRRKAEIYAGKTLALQAMSRSADGTGVDKRGQATAPSGGMPGVVKGLLALAAVGVLAFVAYVVAFQGDPATPPVAGDPLDPPAETGSQAAPEPKPDPVAVASIFDVPSEVDDRTAEASSAKDQSGEADPAIDQQLAAESSRPGPRAQGDTLADPIAVDEPVIEMPPQADLPPLPPEPVEMRVVSWPVDYVDYRPSSNQAISRACDVIKRILVRDESALIGVDVGPEAADLRDSAYLHYRLEMLDILESTAEAEGVLGSLVIRKSDETRRINGIDSHLIYATLTGRSVDVAAIVTTVQDGRCASYWFAGNKRAYRQFERTIGRAEFGPVESPLN